MLRRRLLPLLLLLTCAVFVLLLAPSWASATPAFGDGDGLHVLSVSRLDQRLIEVSVTSAALPGPAKVRLLLPANYEAKPTRRYPVLYLLHGTNGGAADWTVKGDAERTTAGLPLIVVMPDIGLNDNGGGFCTNWVNGGAYGVPEWETFHITQLIPWIDQNLRTIPARKARAIAGLSQGGFCSTSYAARHPDLFSTVLGYSGAPDIAYSPDVVVGTTAIINTLEVAWDGVPPNSIFGDRATNEINWAAHDPAMLAENLRGMNILMYWGTGEPGPLDETPPEAGAMSLEALINRDNIDFRERLQSLSIPAYYDAYGPGTHSWPYWVRDLTESIGPIMEDFAHPRANHKAITYTSADDQYSVYGWNVTMHRTAREFSTLEEAGRHGFALAGSGSGAVVTPAAYAPGMPYLVTLRGQRIASTATAVADPEGRLHIEIPLGPPNPYQQDTAQAMAAGTTVYTTSVSIGARPKR